MKNKKKRNAKQEEAEALARGERAEASSGDDSESEEAVVAAAAAKVGKKRKAKAPAAEEEVGDEEEADEDEDAIEENRDRPRPKVEFTGINAKEKCLILSSRGVTSRYRHLMLDIGTLIPHSKKDSKLDTKNPRDAVVEVADMKSCTSAMFFECRKRTDCYMWLAKCPEGPSVKFHVENVHTMAELKLTGNHLKFSRPALHFDASFDDAHARVHDAVPTPQDEAFPGSHLHVLLGRWQGVVPQLPNHVPGGQGSGWAPGAAFGNRAPALFASD
jgi:hypothetical protein